MWSANTSVADACLSTPFIEGIATGTLDPTTYGGFCVNDLYYCFNGAEDYMDAADRTPDAQLSGYLMAKFQSYNAYNETLTTTWHINDGTAIVPTPVCKAYSDFETSVAGQAASIYALIVMLPCEYLWAWIAGQLAGRSPRGNLYQPWIAGNLDPSGAYKMGNFLVDYMSENPGLVDPDEATKIYTEAITYEWQNFQAALG